MGKSQDIQFCIRVSVGGENLPLMVSRNRRNVDLMGGERGTERDGTGGAEGRRGGRGGRKRCIMVFKNNVYINMCVCVRERESFF